MTNAKKVVFITGAADGIGFQLAKQLTTKAKNSPSTDYLVVATALRLTEELEGLASCEDAVCRVLKMDVTDYKACEEVIQNVIQTEGKIDILGITLLPFSANKIVSDFGLHAPSRLYIKNRCVQH